jgi:co-chaperonin GroES (HSP10)
MKAVNNYIIIVPIKEKPVEQNGLLITDAHTNDIRYLKGTVKSFGEACRGLAENDVIYYDRHAGHGVEWDSTLYQVIKQQDVVAVL